ncbi:MAG TPA: cob(I)yrinic acid a,c-diamide adenosyltransferase [Pseudogracilibacillus sp.]|nr:cob(I)yrinic acid a,c-diamide adenosyltransferase [Pseudogracilibacillus sp.]
MKIYTRTGDKGQTGIIGGRVEKDDLRVEAYGTVDELNGFVALAHAELDIKLNQDIADDLIKIQHELFDLGGDLASVIEKRPDKMNAEMITYLEEQIDRYTEEAPALEKFILPGGSKAAATLHIVRTVARRSERLVVSLMKEDDTTSELALQYLNRLSDYFFAVARIVNYRAGIEDVEYERSAIVFRESRKDKKK